MELSNDFVKYFLFLSPLSTGLRSGPGFVFPRLSKPFINNTGACFLQAFRPNGRQGKS
jgi:hypothetical protein